MSDTEAATPSDVLHIYLRDEGKFLSTRERGEAAVEIFKRVTTSPGDVILDFEGVEAATPPYLQVLLDAVAALLIANQKTGRIVLAASLNEDVAETLRYVAGYSNRGVAYLHGDQLDLLIDRPQLLQTLREAQRLNPFFTAPELAKRLHIRPDAATQRLKGLLALGAAVREEDPQAKRGRRHLYRVADPSIANRDVEPDQRAARKPAIA